MSEISVAADKALMKRVLAELDKETGTRGCRGDGKGHPLRNQRRGLEADRLRSILRSSKGSFSVRHEGSGHPYRSEKAKEMMTEVQAWRYLAKKWKKAASLRGTPYSRPRIVVPGEMPSVALCISLDDLYHVDLISDSTRTKMDDRMRCWTPQETSRDGYWWPKTSKGARARAAFCLFMAQMVEE